MTDPRGSRFGGRLRGTAAALVVGLALIGCGGDGAESDVEDNNDTRPEATEIQPIIAASPAVGTPGRGGLPQDAVTQTVAIRDGRLDPETISGETNLPYILTVEGDGQPHTIAIEGLVDEEPIAADGPTQVQFNIPPDQEGDKPILLDGEEAGTLQVQGPGGVEGT